MPKKRRNVRRRGRNNRGPSRNAMLPSVRAMKSLSTPYVFRLCNSGDIVSTPGGQLNVAIPVDPSSSGINFDEWETITLLFSQFRVVAFSVQFCLTDNTLNGAPVCIGGSFSSFAAPGSYNAVAENADSRFWQASLDKTRTGYKHTLRFPRRIDFSNTGTPVPGDWAGAPGAIQVFASGWPESTNCVSYLVEGFYEFMSRS